VLLLIGIKGPGNRMSSVPVKPMMALSGVRNSWLMVARNRSLAWLAFSSSTFFSCNVRSKRLRSVISRMELLTSVPSSVSSGLRLISTGNSVPSFRRPKSSAPRPSAHLRIAKEPGAMLRVPASEPLGYEHFDGLVEQFPARVAKQAFRLRVHQNHFS